MRIAITGAAGDLGRKVVEDAISKVDPASLILISRDPGKLADFAALGAEVRHGDFDHPDSLSPALAGAERMLLISTADIGERRRAQHRAAIRAAEATPGMRHIVYTSSVGILPGNPCFIIPDHRYTEQLLSASSVPSTILRMNSYADVVVSMVAPQAVATGQWISRSGDGLVGWVAKHDCAAAAVGVLTGSGHEGAIYEITGPDMLSNRQIAALVSELSGKPIDYIVPADEPAGPGTDDVDQAEDEQASKWTSYSLDALKTFEYAVRDGYNAVCSRHVEIITGRPALPFRQLLLDNRRLLHAA